MLRPIVHASRFALPRMALLLATLSGPVAAASQATLRVGEGQLPTGFVEDFALAEDRGATLDRLLVGTEPHYYFSCLHGKRLNPPP
ncbi:MAG: hypothetical protein AAGG01_20345 [Planctomycetota bacterium]